MLNFIGKLDKLFCTYLGFKKQVATPNSVKIFGNELIITITESYKRHFQALKWDNFSSGTLNQLDEPKKKNLGIAMGKAIAKNLTISFDNISIQSDKIITKKKGTAYAR